MKKKHVHSPLSLILIWIRQAKHLKPKVCFISKYHRYLLYPVLKKI